MDVSIAIDPTVALAIIYAIRYLLMHENKPLWFWKAGPAMPAPR